MIIYEQKSQSLLNLRHFNTSQKEVYAVHYFTDTSDKFKLFQ